MKRYLSIAAVLLMTISSVSYAADNGQQEVTFTQIDANHDSLLTQDEFHQEMQKNFDLIDSNNDGKITQNEYANMQKHDQMMDANKFGLSDSTLFFD